MKNYPSGKLKNIKNGLRKIHFYLAICFGCVFVILGLTGSLIAWLPELDQALNPNLLKVIPASTNSATTQTQVISGTQITKLLNKLNEDPQYAYPTQLTLPEQPNQVVVAWYLKENREKSILSQRISRQVMIDPYTLNILGERNWGELGLSHPLLMSTLFHLHRYLVAGKLGKILVGISGLVLVIVTFSGLILWWPKLKRSTLRQSFRITYGGSWPRLNYSFHRSIGFFAFPVFLMLGFSGFYFNLPKWGTPLITSMTTISPKITPNNRLPLQGKQISPSQALHIAQKEFPTATLTRIVFPSNLSLPYEIRARQRTELRENGGDTRLFVDAYSGEILSIRDPLRASGGDKFVSWLFPLHSGEAFGIIGRIFISLFGLMPLLFFITGLSIYLKRTKNK